jgi:hypothetical protein
MFSTGTLTLFTVSDEIAMEEMVTILIKNNECGTGSRRVRSFDSIRFNALLSFNDEHRQALVSAYTSYEIIRKYTICDPFLGAVHDIVLSCGRSVVSYSFWNVSGVKEQVDAKLVRHSWSKTLETCLGSTGKANEPLKTYHLASWLPSF